MSTLLETVIARQDQLITALDGRDPEAIETATVALADALGALGAMGAVHGLAEDRLDHAVRQSQAARIRLNVLSDWTRQRIDRLDQLRSKSSSSRSNRYVSSPAI